MSADKPYSAQILYTSAEDGTDQELVESFASEAEARAWLNETGGHGHCEKELFRLVDGRYRKLDYPV
jgi:hypothetical protein